jgi:hypothetical protein
MCAPPTSADHTKSGFAAWILEMVGPKLVTSSGKKSIAGTSPPFSVTYFFTHCEVIWP